MQNPNSNLEKLPNKEVETESSESKQVETIKSPENIIEFTKEENIDISDDSNLQTKTQQVQKIPKDKEVLDDLNKKIDDILEDGLVELYMQIPKEKQLEFKQKGEETAGKIFILLRETKVKVKKILDLIVNWLSIIPGVNKFFIKQEAKIKTGKLLELKQKEEEKK